MESITKIARGIASEIFVQVIRVFKDMSASGSGLVARNAPWEDRSASEGRMMRLLFANPNRFLTNKICAA